MTNPHDPRQLLSDSIGHKGQEYIKATPLRRAAPDLLEALESILSAAEADIHGAAYELLREIVIHEAKTAIIKAKE